MERTQVEEKWIKTWKDGIVKKGPHIRPIHVGTTRKSFE